MTKDEFIFKKLARVGDCWHKWKRIQVKRPKGRSVTIACIYCNAILSSKTANPDFTTWEGFGWMWERVIEKEWFFEFFKKLPVNTFWRAEIAQTMHLNNPIRLRDELADYFGWEGSDEIHKDCQYAD